MKKTSLTGVFIGLALTAFGGLIVVDNINGTQKKPRDKSIKTDVKSVKTEICFVTGKLNITNTPGGEFFTADFDCKKDKWKPEVTFDTEGQKGHLKISSKDESGHRDYDESDESHWELNFNQKTENDLNIEIFAAEGKMDLSGCNLKAFHLNMKAGDINLDLTNTSVPYLSLKAIAGEADINLTGKWENDLKADIKGGVGELMVRLPSDIGVKMEISGLLGDVTANGFIRNGQYYTNALYGKTKYTLYLDIFGGIGDITVIME